MRRRNVVLATVSACLIGVVVLYSLFIDHLPPDSPQKRARVISGLPIPQSSVVDTVESHGGLFEGASFMARLRIEPSAFARLVEQTKQDGFTVLPLRNGGGNPVLARYAVPSAKGWYRQKWDAGGYSIVVVDVTSRTVLAWAMAN